VTDRRHTRPLVREGAPQRQHSNFQTENIWLQVPVCTGHQDILTDWQSVVTWLWLCRTPHGNGNAFINEIIHSQLKHVCIIMPRGSCKRHTEVLAPTSVGKASARVTSVFQRVYPDLWKSDNSLASVVTAWMFICCSSVNSLTYCLAYIMFVLYWTPWLESESDRRLSAMLVPTFADIGCHVVNVTDPTWCCAYLFIWVTQCILTGKKTFPYQHFAVTPVIS
jgi:hypothetical protein